jgi:hypothetical protein
MGILKRALPFIFHLQSFSIGPVGNIPGVWKTLVQIYVYYVASMQGVES